MNWIKLSDEQPQCHHRVLCYRPDKFVVIGKTVVGTNFCHFQGEDGFRLSGVTHWMPLPEPPTLENTNAN